MVGTRCLQRVVTPQGVNILTRGHWAWESCACGDWFWHRLQEKRIPSLKMERVVLNAPVFYPLPARTALNVPCFEGRSPRRGENSTSPLIEPSVSNFPLNSNVPGSRPTLPIRNSTGPENVTEFPSAWVQFASEGLAGPQTFNRGSSNRKEPFPAPCASKRNERWSSFAKVISTVQLPIMFGDCAWAKATQHVCKINIRITRQGLATPKCCTLAGARRRRFLTLRFSWLCRKGFRLANVAERV
jgi:hypothetical protein